MKNPVYYRIFFLSIIFILNVQILQSQDDLLISARAEPNRNFAIPALSDYLTARFNDCFYVIRPTGLVTKHFTYKPDSLSFKIDVTDHFTIERADVYHIDNSLIIAYTETDFETGGSKVTKYDLENLKKDWTFSQLPPNLSKLVISDECIYVAAFGTIAKLDFNTGKPVFIFYGLYDREKYAFNSFSDIVFNGDTVTFLSKNWYSKSLDKVLVNIKTNTIMTINK